MTDIDLPLFRWTHPECKIIPYPSNKRIGKIRDVAQKWFAQSTDRQAAVYLARIESDMNQQFGKLGFPDAERKKIWAKFSRELDREINRIRMARQRQKPNQPGGAA